MWLYTVVYLYTIYTENILVYILYILQYRALVEKTMSSHSRNISKWRRLTRAKHAWSIFIVYQPIACNMNNRDWQAEILSLRV